MKASVLSMRRRSVWEAADSGILLWRKNILLFIPFYALPVFITAFALYFFSFGNTWLPWLGIWWLKPFFDRFCLHIISKRFFKGNTEKLFSGLKHTLFFSLAGDLLWRRFSPFRCSCMPLRLMERLKPKQFEERKKSLSRGGLYFSALVSSLGLPLELFLLGGEIIFFALMFDLFSSSLVFLLFGNHDMTPLLIYAAFCINYILVGSLYVCMGFGIYINSRVEVEGWDIELLFKKFSKKDSNAAAIIPKSGAVLGSVLILVFGLLFSTPLSANDIIADNIAEQFFIEENAAEEKIFFPEDFLPLEEVPMDTLEEVLASGDFGGTRPAYRVQPKNPREPRVQPLPRDLNPWFDDLREALAHGLRIFIIVILSALFVFLIVRLYQLRQSKKPIVFEEAHMYTNPLTVKGRPDFFFEKAQVLFEQGFFRKAWAACLCGVLNSFHLYFGISFPKQVTEYGCLKLVCKRFPSDSYLTGEFGELVHNWVLLAYGAKIPLPGSFEKALEFGRSLEPMQHNKGKIYAQ